MKDEIVSSVSDVLSEWNPLGEEASTVESLEGYKYEAMDILSIISISKISTEKAVKEVLTQAFGVDLDQAQLKFYSAKIDRILNVQ